MNLQQVVLLQTTPHPLQASLPWGEGQGDPKGLGESTGLLPGASATAGSFTRELFTCRGYFCYLRYLFTYLKLWEGGLG